MLIITTIVASSILFTLIHNQFGERIFEGCCLPVWRKIQPKWKYIVWYVYRIIFKGWGNLLEITLKQVGAAKDYFG